MFCSSICSSLLEKVSPSIRVQETYKNKLLERVKLAASAVFALLSGLFLSGLMNPMTFQAVILSAMIASFALIATAALTAYECKRMEYDRDADFRAKSRSNERNMQLLLLEAIESIPYCDRNWFFEMANEISEATKEENFLKAPFDRLIKHLKITSFALSLFLLVGHHTNPVAVLKENGKFDDNMGIRRLVIGRLEKLDQATDNYLPELNPLKIAEFLREHSKNDKE